MATMRKTKDSKYKRLKEERDYLKNENDHNQHMCKVFGETTAQRMKAFHTLFDGLDDITRADTVITLLAELYDFRKRKYDKELIDKIAAANGDVVITQKTCVNIGGHCWKRREANYSTKYPDGSPRYRVCKHCGRREDLTKLKGIKGGDRK